MPDVDKVLEAEQSIQAMAGELRRMRDAADLLNSSQKQMDEILDSAQKVLQTTEKFSQDCGIIVTKLAATDLNQRFDELQNLHYKLATGTNSLKEALLLAVGELNNNIQTAANSLSVELKANDEHSHSGFEQIASLVEARATETKTVVANLELQLKNLENQFQIASKSSKSRQITSLIFTILTFVVAIILLAKSLVPNLGG